MLDPELTNLLRLQHGVSRVHLVQGGLSGARLFRCEGLVPFALRRWPMEVRADRVSEIARVVEFASESCALVPKRLQLGEGEYYRDVTGYLWTLESWIPGQPLRCDATIDEIALGLEAISEVHAAFRGAGRQKAPAPSIAERLRRVENLNHEVPRALGSANRPPVIAEELERATHVLASHWGNVAPDLSQRLRHRRGDVTLQWVVRDVHREHVLFEAENVRGIIDFDAIRVDFPLLDVTRWITGFDEFQRDPEGLIRRALAGFSLGNAFPDDLGPADAYDWIVVLAAANSWISLANWVVWTTLESRQFSDWQRVKERMRRLIDLAPISRRLVSNTR